MPIPKYFASEWSFAQFRIQQQQQPPSLSPSSTGATAAAPTAADEGRCIVGFVPSAPHTLVVVTSGGSYYKVTFDPVKGGQCTQQAFGSYIRQDSDP